MANTRNILISTGVATALLFAGMLSGCASEEVHKPPVSEPTNEIQHPQADPSMRIYLNDGVDSESALAFVEEIKKVEGVTNALYVDETTAKEQANDPESGVTLAKAHIDYTISPDVDSVVISETIYAIEGVKDASVTDSPAVPLAWVNNGDGKMTEGEYVRVESDRELSDGVMVHSIDWVPIGEEVEVASGE